MSILPRSEVNCLIQEEISKKFGSNAQVYGNGGCLMVVVMPEIGNETSGKFSQVMHYLSNPRKWFYRESHAAEDAYESALVHLKIPFKVNASQQTEFIYKPPVRTGPLDVFCKEPDPSELQKARENHEMLIQCYDVIDRALNARKFSSYRKKVSREVYGQRSLLDFNRSEESETRKPRNEEWRKMRLDVAYDVREVPAIIFGEIKAFSTVASGLLDERAQQLLGYDAWLKIRGDKGITPFMYILPTMPTHREIKMAEYVGGTTSRDVIPLCITTPEYLKGDFEKRERSLEIIENLSKRTEISPEVLETHRKEHEHVLKFMRNLC